MSSGIDEAMRLALQFHQAGSLVEAEELYRQILAQEPQNSDALHLLGVLATQTERFDLAINLISQAIAGNEAAPAYHFNLGAVLQRTGRLPEAINAYRRTVELTPDFAPALSNLAAALKGNGQLTEAIDIFRRVVKCNPRSAEAFNSLGTALAEHGQSDEAIVALNQAITLNPEYAGAHFNLGSALNSAGKKDDAIIAYLHAIRIRPDVPLAHYQLGRAYQEQGKFDRAVAAYQEAARLKPDYAEAWSNLGTAQKDLGKLGEAVAAYRESLRFRPDDAQTHNNLGNVLKEQGKLDQAISSYREALRLRPDVALVHYNLGVGLIGQDKPTQAIAAYREAIRLSPDYADAHNNLGVALMSEGRLEESIAAFKNAVQFKSNFGDAHLSIAWAMLLGGNFEDGWREFESRWESSVYRGIKRRSPEEQWDGRDLNGQRILLYAEGGLGDTIQFIRYAPLIAARGGKVIFECPAPLVSLLRGLPGLEQIIPAGERLPQFDLLCPLMSLPLNFKTTIRTIPASVPYLHPDSRLVEEWSRKLPPDPGRPRIGLVWAGNRQNMNDRNRSMPLQRFAPLAAVKNARYYSLQVGPAGEEARHSPPGMDLIDYTDGLHDFTDTAAMVANLDLVIAVDTSVAHLAGALAKPIWLLVPYLPDWRWMLHRDDSLWYPTMRLFRQKARGDWTGVIKRLVDSLVEFSPHNKTLD